MVAYETEAPRTSWTNPDGSVQDGAPCTRCGWSYEACTRKLRHHGNPCCSTCRNTGTHDERTLLRSMDPRTTKPMAGDTVLYTGHDDAVYGGVVEEAYELGPQGSWHFRIVGHDGLFCHTPDPAWKSRRILRRSLAKAAAEPDLHAVCKRNLASMGRDLDAARAKLDMFKRHVDRDDLSKLLFITHMMATYGILTREDAEAMWGDLSEQRRAEWATVAAVAEEKLLATDV